MILAREPAPQAIAARRQIDQMLAKLNRSDDYTELPGAQVEIVGLAEMFPALSVTVLTQADASEDRLEALRRDGKLETFRYLHLATPGQANNVLSFDSALILTRPAQVPDFCAGEPFLDGRLTAAEVLEYWELDAALVTLSACEAEPGREGGGDGLVALAQSFLLAGSRAVCLSLWKVDPTARVLLMDRFYRNLLGQRGDGTPKMGKAAALREAKHWLRTLPVSEAEQQLGKLTQGVFRGSQLASVPKPKESVKDYQPYASPRYWSAFVLFGDPD